MFIGRLVQNKEHHWERCRLDLEWDSCVRSEGTWWGWISIWYEMGIHEQTHYWRKVSMLNTHKIHIFFELECCCFPIQHHKLTIYFCCLEISCVFLIFYRPINFVDFVSNCCTYYIYCLIWICDLGGKLIPQQRYTTKCNDFKLLDN